MSARARRRAGAGRLRRVLHATDFSPASRAAFEQAVRLARDNGAELTVVHVLSPVVPMAGDGYVSPKVYADLEAAARADATRQMRALVARARARGVGRVRGLLRYGLAHEQIARAARGQRADLIVIGTHGRTGLARFFLGSVASRVVGHATRPVLTVRGR
jgi:nucleotide-binding universal stress UspA family protein